MPEKTLIHASFSTINTFRPLTHFGSRAAAIAVMKNRIRDGRVPVGGQQVHLHHVKVTLNNPVRSQRDYGSPRPMVYVQYLADQLHPDHGPAYLGFITPHRDALTRIGGGDASIRSPKLEQMLDYVADLFRQHGYDGIIYTNEVEDKGSESWVIIDNSQAQTLRVEQSPVAGF